MTSRLYPPTPPHLVKGHNCQNPRCRSLSSGALQPTPPPKPARSKERGEAHSRPIQGKQTTREISEPDVRAQPVTTTPPPLRESTQEQRPEHTKRGRAPQSITDRGTLPLWRMRYLTDAQGTTTYHPPSKRDENRVSCLNPQPKPAKEPTQQAIHPPPPSSRGRTTQGLRWEQSTTSESGTAASQEPPKPPAGKTYSNAPWPHSPSHADH